MDQGENLLLRAVSVVVVVLALVILIPQASAGFKTPPTFDLETSNNLAGSTDAIYTLRAENPDQAEDAFGLSITIPAGYSIGEVFMTGKSQVRVMSAYGSCPSWTGDADVTTTSTPGQFKMAHGAITIGEIVVTAPSTTGQGKMEMTFSGSYSLMNRGCHGELTTAKGFFINPSEAGTYTWAPSTAVPKSGSSVMMEPKSGYTQSITIAGIDTTTSLTTAETESSATTQVASSTSIQVTTTIPEQTSTFMTTAYTTMIETGAPTVAPPPSGGQLPMELLAGGVAVAVVIAAAAILLLRRKSR